MTNGERYKTCEERIEAHDAYCASRVGACDGECDRCAFAWLAMEYKPKPMPCPFCGCAEIMNLEGQSGVVFLECAKCGISTGWHKNKNDAIEAWNRRVK